MILDGQIFVGGYGETTPPQAVLTISEHSGPYYLFCEVYGKTDQIEIIDPATLTNPPVANDNHQTSVHGNVIDLVNKKLQKTSTNNHSQLQHFNYLHASNEQHNLNFLSTNRHNVLFTQQNRIVCVNNLRIKYSYTFVNTPMKLGDVFICKVMDCDTNISSILLFGLTTCNPNSLQNQNLPEETTALISQYSSSKWFVDQDIGGTIAMYDELAFWFDSNGRVYLSIDNRSPIELKFTIPSSEINNSTFYPFFDLYGQVTSLYLFNYSTQTKLNFQAQSNARSLCSICYENLADTQFLPCLCVLCSQCAAVIKKPSLLSDCPFDRKHIAQVRTLT